MALNRAIESGKEKRKLYTKAKAVSPECRNHGGCPYCKAARLFNQRKKEQTTLQKLKEWKQY